MSLESLLEEIEEFRTTKIFPKISANTPATPDEIQELGQGINRFMERSTTGQEQLLLEETRGLLANIPREKSPAKTYPMGSSGDYY